MNRRDRANPPSRYIAPMIDSRTAACSEEGMSPRPVHALSRVRGVHRSPVLRRSRAQDPTTDHVRLDLGQLAFEKIRVSIEELRAHDHAQNRIAEELEPLVGVESKVRRGGVTQRPRQEFPILESIPDSPFGFRQSVHQFH